MLLKDKVALVTGSTHNIGLGIARAFAREGAKVVVHSHHEEDAKNVAQEIGGDFFAADVAKPEQVAAMFNHIKKNHGRLDILVNGVLDGEKIACQVNRHIAAPLFQGGTGRRWKAELHG